MDQELVYFFGYDIFLDHRNLRLRNDEIVLGLGVLNSYKLTFCPAPSIIKTDNKDDLVWGLIYCIYPTTLANIGQILGYPTLSSKIRRNVELINSEKYLCSLFKASKLMEASNMLSPDQNSIDIMRIAAKNLDLPKNYQEFLDKIAKLR